MKLFFLLIGCILNLSLMAQNGKYFNIAMNNAINLNSNGRVMCMDNNGTYFIGGDTRHNGLVFDGQPFFIETNNTGSLLRFNELIDTTREAVILGLVTTDSLIFGAGYENLPNTSSTYYVMAKKDGTLIQEGNVGDTLFVNSGYTACRAHDGGFLIGGEIQPYDPPNGQPTHPYLVKLDSAGNKLWDTIYYQYGNPYAWFMGISPSPDGNGYLITGSVNNNKGSLGDVLFLKIDDTGSIIWDKVLQYGHYCVGNHITPTLDKGYLITSARRANNQLNSVLTKLDSNRIETWHVIDYFGGGVAARGCVQLDDGNYVLGGTARESPSADLDAVFVKIDTLGGLVWRRTYDQAGFNDYAYDMLATPDGGYLACGRTEYYDFAAGISQANLYLLKVNCMGLQTLPQAMFINSSIDTNYLCVFQNLSQFVYPDSTDGGHYIWDFGDDTPPLQTTTDAFVPHYYPNYGTYRVSLTAIVCNDTSTYTQTINLWATGTDNALCPTAPNTLAVLYPNPAQNQLMLYYQPQSTTEQAEANLSIKNFAGNTIYQTTLPTAGSYRINTSTWAAGMYFCEISQANAAPITQKVLIVK